MLYIYYILLAIAIGFALCAALFGLTMLLSPMVSKGKLRWTGPLVMPAISAALLAIIFREINFGYSFCTVSQLCDWNNWILFASGVVLTVLIVNIKRVKVRSSIKDIVLSMLGGAAMEIPQRMLMQTLVLTLLTIWNVPDASIWACIVNAIIWCMGIISQAVIMKQPFDVKLAEEFTASFIFSMFIGYLLVRSNMVLFPMLAHMSERAVSMVIRNCMAKGQSQNIAE